MGASQAKHIYIKEKKIKKSSRLALEINTDSRYESCISNILPLTKDFVRYFAE
jgi:hypothetical protein